MKNVTSRSVLALIAVFGFASLGNTATVYYLNDSNEGGLPDDVVTWATVTVELLGNGNVKFTVAVVPQPAYYTPGDNFGIQHFGFNGIAGSTALTAANLILPADWSFGTDGNRDGFGDYDYLLDGDGSSRQDPLVFQVTGIAGDAIATYYDLANPAGAQGPSYFAAHIAGFSSDVIGNPGSFWVGGGNPGDGELPPVPLPAAVWLLGSGLLGLIGFGRRRRGVN